MNYCGCGVLPPDVHTLHLVDLKGPYILQLLECGFLSCRKNVPCDKEVDEMVNISSPLWSRYQKAAPGLKRCLKLSMTDGVQRVFGMEYRLIKDLEVLSPAGLKFPTYTVLHFISLLLVLLHVDEHKLKLSNWTI